MEFNGKVVLITGGSSGIGLEVGRLMAQRGAHVWLAARDGDRLASALSQIESARRTSEQRLGIVNTDVIDPAQVTAAVEGVTEKCGAPDILVNSAGVVHPALFCDTESDIFRHLMEVNYFGTVNASRACLPSMLERRRGHIVNISSVYGFMGGYCYTAYCASKYAVRGFTDALRAELRPQGIHVSLVFPQNTATPQLDYENELKPAVVKALDNTHVMSANEVARAIINGIIRKKYVIIPGTEGKLLYWFSGISSTALYWIMDRMIDRAIKKMQ